MFTRGYLPKKNAAFYSHGAVLTHGGSSKFPGDPRPSARPFARRDVSGPPFDTVACVQLPKMSVDEFYGLWYVELLMGFIDQPSNWGAPSYVI